MKKFLVPLLLVLAVAIGAAIWLYSTFDNQTTATVASVVDEFREVKGPDATAPTQPKQGVYSYSVTGEERISRTGLDVKRTLPTQAPALVYNLPSGEFEIKTKFSEQHVEVNRYKIEAGQTVLTYAITDIAVGPLTVNRKREWSPTLVRFPKDAKPGATTTGDFTAGDLKLKVKTTVLPAESVIVGGTAVPATVVKFDQDVTGEYSGFRTETFYWSEDGTLLRYTIDSSLKGPTNLDFKADQTLTSLTPEI